MDGRRGGSAAGARGGAAVDAADLAERGQWRTLADDPDETFAVLAARRIVGDPRAPTDAALRASFLREGRWWATRPLYARALIACVVDHEPPAPPAQRSHLPTVEGGGLPRALALHAALVSLPQTKLHGGDIGLVVRAWDEALDDAGLQTLVTKRALELRAPVADRAIGDLRATVATDLARLAVGARVGIGELAGEGEIARKVAWQLRDVLLAEVEALLETLKPRVDARKDAPAWMEWRELLWRCAGRTSARRSRAGSSFEGWRSRGCTGRCARGRCGSSTTARSARWATRCSAGCSTRRAWWATRAPRNSSERTSPAG